MLSEFGGVVRKYWLFMTVKLAYNMAAYFATNDVNFGNDSTGRFEWITEEGRLNLIHNATDLDREARTSLP